jgi:alanyl-tRNA synthetase
MRTRRLFEEAPYQKTFQAKVLESRKESGKINVILDQTLFYPVSGGQPCDHGSIHAVPVKEVFEQNEVIVHVLEKHLEKSAVVQGEIDWERRFDHMQQHSGQHILSQTFFRLFGSETVGFHLGEESSTIDLDLPDLSAEHLLEIEMAANHIVFENRLVLVYSVPSQELQSLPIRKYPENKGDVRVVEIKGFDWSGCCGTHVNQTGEVGVIKIIRNDHNKGGSRIGFLCGRRALHDYQEKQVVVRETCRLLTAGEDEVLSILNRWHEDRKVAARRTRALTDALLNYEVSALYAKAESIGPNKCIVSLHEDMEPEDIQNLVKKLIQKESVIALLGLKKEKAYLCFGRSQSVKIDMRPILSDACRVIDGKGGGSPFLAQGNGPDVSQISEALRIAKASLLRH